MSTNMPLELPEHDAPILDADANTFSYPSFIDFLENKDVPLATSQTETDISSTNAFNSTDALPNAVDPNTTISTNAMNTCIEGDVHNDRTGEIAKNNETMSYDFSSPGFIAENTDAANAFNFTQAVPNVADSSSTITTDELSANAKVEITDSNIFSDSMSNSKGEKYEKRKRYILERLLVSKDKSRKNKWRAYFFYDKFRQATFDTPEDCYLFHKMLRKKLAQSNSCNDKASMDELVAHMRETTLHDAAKNMKMKSDQEEEETTSSENYSSSLKSNNELNLNSETFIDEARTSNRPQFTMRLRSARHDKNANAETLKDEAKTNSNNEKIKKKNANAETLKDKAKTNNNNKTRIKNNRCNRCAFTIFDQNTECWKAYFNYDKFRYLGSFATNNEANYALEAVLKHVQCKSFAVRKGLFLRNAFLCFDKRCDKWRSCFTYDKRRQIGAFATREEALLALAMLCNKFQESDVKDKTSIDAIVKQIYYAICSQNITIHLFEVSSSLTSNESNISATDNTTESKTLSEKSIDEIVEHIHNAMSSLENAGKAKNDFKIVPASDISPSCPTSDTSIHNTMSSLENANKAKNDAMIVPASDISPSCPTSNTSIHNTMSSLENANKAKNDVMIVPTSDISSPCLTSNTSIHNIMTSLENANKAKNDAMIVPASDISSPCPTSNTSNAVTTNNASELKTPF